MHQRKAMLNVWHYASQIIPPMSWILVKTSQQKSIVRKSAELTRNCNVYVQHWSIEDFQLFSVTMLNHMSHKWFNRIWMNWATKLPLPTCSPDFCLDDYHFFKHLCNFLQKLVSDSQAAAENIFAEFISSRPHQLYITRINRLVECW